MSSIIQSPAPVPDRSENASLDRSGASARRSVRIIRINATTVAAISTASIARPVATLASGGIRAVFGEAGLDRLIEARQKAAVAAYRRALEPCCGLEDRVRTVARLRSQEGYMAEFEADPDGSFLLIENHCPICAAAKTCQ